MSTGTSGRMSEVKRKKEKGKRGGLASFAFSLLSFAFTPAGQMAVPRVYHTATALPDGSVLVCGGYGAGRILDSAERYDPVLGQFLPAGRMTVAREYAAAAPLPGGRVLITGGRSSDQMASSAELYDPALDAFQPLPPMSVPRGEHTANSPERWPRADHRRHHVRRRGFRSRRPLGSCRRAVR